MAIRIRRGNQVDFDGNKLVAGEPGLVLDKGEVYFCFSPGNTKKLMTGEDLQNLLDATPEAYQALQQLVEDLEADPNELANILSNISSLQSGKADLVGCKVPSEQLPPISSTADAITYDNAISGLDAENTQDAIDEVSSQLAENAIEFNERGVNVKAFGAKGDGITDDAPAIRAAIAFMKLHGFRKLFFPEGIYYVASGDERGLSGDGIFSNGDYYSCFEILDNMFIEGVGASSKILYESNRLGYNLANSRGDVGSMFSNFRVLGNDGRYQVSGTVSIKNIDFEFTELAEGEKDSRDYIDGQILRLIAVENNKHGNIIIENVNVYKHCGHQIFSVYNATKYSENNVNVYGFAKETNSANSDFSSCYVNADIATIVNSVVESENENNNGTAFEVHGEHAVVAMNKVTNCNTFINAVGSADLADGANFEIRDNNIIANTLCTYWTYSDKKIKSITIDGNEFKARVNSGAGIESVCRNEKQGSVPDEDIIPVDLIKVTNTRYASSNLSIAASDAVMSNAHLMFKFVIEVIVENNNFNDCRRGLIQLNSRQLKRYTIKNNKGYNLLWGTPETITTQSYRSFIYHFTGPGFAELEKMDVSDNSFSANFIPTSQLSYGYFFNNNSNASYNNKDFVVTDNTFKGILREIAIKDNASSGEYVNSFYIKHRYSGIGLEPQATSNLYSGKQNMHKNGGHFSLPQDFGLIMVDMQASNYIGSFYGSAPPTVGYWKKGSRVLNTNPSGGGYAGWICVAEGAPGTWKRYGLIEA